MANNFMPMKEHDLRQFSWDAAEGELVAEASTLGGFPLERIWNDAADAGIAVRSHYTGRVERFAFSCEFHHDGELVACKYENIDRTSRVRELTILND